jgi:hypothetical protein
MDQHTYDTSNYSLQKFPRSKKPSGTTHELKTDGETNSGKTNKGPHGSLLVVTAVNVLEMEEGCCGLADEGGRSNLLPFYLIGRQNRLS